MSTGLVNTQTETIGERQSITIWEMCQVKSGGIQLMTLTTVCML
jgi:hypothetical protein